MSDKIIQLNEDLIKHDLKDLVRSSVEETWNALLDKEADELVNAEKYERSSVRQGYRSGHYKRNLHTTAGEVELKVPKLIPFETAIIERYRRRKSSVEEALIEMYLAGVSVRRVEDITEALWGTKVSLGTISNLNKKAYAILNMKKSNHPCIMSERRRQMAYSELIKNFEKIRAYIREFYIYGFKSRNEYDRKSARSYDNEKRRIESWLGNYISFHQDTSGKNVFLSVDSRNITINPLYEAFKAKSFTDRDIILHFFILDMLADGTHMTTKDMMDAISEEYLNSFENIELPDESSLRRKLKEYEKMGIVQSEKKGKTVFYNLCDSDIPLKEWKDSVAFYSEENPLGVIGSYIGDRTENNPDYFSFKHHYILHALDSEVLYQLLTAIGEKKKVLIDIKSLHQKEVFPVKILISTQTGRQYLLAYYYAYSEFIIYRIDNITDVNAVEQEEDYEKILEAAEVYMKHLWGVSSGGRTLDHIEMTVHIDPWEQHIPRRLEREKRNGRVEKIDRCTYRYIADVYDAMEMLPWLRTFIGRVQELKCTNSNVTKIFYEDLKTMQEMYGGEEDAVQ